MRRSWTGVLSVTLLGAAGGAINAGLCLARFPVPVEDDPKFGRLVLPGGALHGAALALVAMLAAAAASNWRWPLPVVAAPIVGWAAGYLSWIPLNRWVLEESWSKSFLWPLRESSWMPVLWSPFMYFGLVSAIYFLALVFGGPQKTRAWSLTSGVGAGVLGSLWWWVGFKPWYLAVIHGTIWGALVGAGAHASSGRPAAHAPADTPGAEATRAQAAGSRP